MTFYIGTYHHAPIAFSARDRDEAMAQAARRFGAAVLIVHAQR